MSMTTSYSEICFLQAAHTDKTSIATKQKDPQTPALPWTLKYSFPDLSADSVLH